MRIKRTNTSQQPFRKSVAFMLVLYWTVLVAWQNISGAETRGSVDVVLKMGLLAYFSWFYLKRARSVNAKILWVLLLAVSMLITACMESEFPLDNVIAYGYPIIFLTMVYGLGDWYEINRKQLLAFCNWVIAVVLYAAIYAMIFCRDQFVNILSVRGAYGNELQSFFLSSHEYGMYLACAMVSCGLCLKYDVGMTPVKKGCYIVSLLILALNLILTFSRTSMFGLAVFLLIFLILGKGKLKRWILAVLLLAGLVILLSPELSDYVYRVVLKGNTLADRDDLLAAGIRFFRSGTVWQKVFGYGIRDTRVYFESYLYHGSAHNAYLQVLLHYGVIGEGFLLAFLFSQVCASLQIFRKNQFFGAANLGLTVMAMAMMFTNTAIVFTSPIDSYFLTVFLFVVPKYVRNAIKNDRFH